MRTGILQLCTYFAGSGLCARESKMHFWVTWFHLLISVPTAGDHRDPAALSWDLRQPPALNLFLSYCD